MKILEKIDPKNINTSDQKKVVFKICEQLSRHVWETMCQPLLFDAKIDEDLPSFSILYSVLLTNIKNLVKIRYEGDYKGEMEDNEKDIFLREVATDLYSTILKIGVDDGKVN